MDLTGGESRGGLAGWVGLAPWTCSGGNVRCRREMEDWGDGRGEWRLGEMEEGRRRRRMEARGRWRDEAAGMRRPLAAKEMTHTQPSQIHERGGGGCDVFISATMTKAPGWSLGRSSMEAARVL